MNSRSVLLSALLKFTVTSISDHHSQIFHRNPKTHLANSDLKAIHALGKSPVLSITPADGDKPLLIAESGFIVEYLADHFGKETTLLPKRWREGSEGKVGGETEEWMRYKYFLHYAEGSLMGFLVLGLVAQSEFLASPGSQRGVP